MSFAQHFAKIFFCLSSGFYLYVDVSCTDILHFCEVEFLLYLPGFVSHLGRASLFHDYIIFSYSSYMFIFCAFNSTIYLEFIFVYRMKWGGLNFNVFKMDGQ